MPGKNDNSQPTTTTFVRNPFEETKKIQDNLTRQTADFLSSSSGKPISSTREQPDIGVNEGKTDNSDRVVGESANPFDTVVGRWLNVDQVRALHQSDSPDDRTLSVSTLKIIDRAASRSTGRTENSRRYITMVDVCRALVALALKENDSGSSESLTALSSALNQIAFNGVSGSLEGDPLEGGSPSLASGMVLMPPEIVKVLRESYRIHIDRGTERVIQSDFVLALLCDPNGADALFAALDDHATTEFALALHRALADRVFGVSREAPLLGVLAAKRRERRS